MKGKIAVTFLVGAGIGLTGCQGPLLGGLPWSRSSASVSSTAPDIGKQKFSGLSQQFAGDQSRAMGQSQSEVGALGGPRSSSDGFFAASWKKTSAAVSGTLASKPKVSIPEDDPLRLDRMPKKIGPGVYIAAARLLENQGKFPEAEAKYREALAAAPNDLNALVSLARLYDRQSQPEKAIEVYQQASRAHPSSSLVYNDLGLCFRRQRQLDQSVVAFRKAVELEAENAKYRNNLAAALVDAGRANEAYELLALANSPAVAHFNVAYLLQQKGRTGEATQHLQEAVTHDPKFTPAREVLAKMAAAPTPAATQSPGTTLPLATTPPSAAQSTVQPVREPAGAYAAGAADQRLYTSAPRIEAPKAGNIEQPSLHIGDEAAPAAEIARRPLWSSAWAIPTSGAAAGSQPLPPTD